VKKLIIILLFAATASASLFLNSFNSGQLGKDLKSRHDLDRTSMGSEELSNILIRPQGMAFKRPGTEFVESRLTSVGTAEVLGDYPTLRATTAQADPGLTHTMAISNVTELQEMEDNRAGNYYLTCNIDASGVEWDPIGTYSSFFTGTLDGCGYTVSNLTISSGVSYASLLGNVLGASVANLTLSDVSIVGESHFTGALAGHVYLYEGYDFYVYNCHSSGTISRDPTEATLRESGGLIGTIERYSGQSNCFAFIYDSSSSCDLDHTGDGTGWYSGGFVGLARNTTFQNCYATGSLLNGDYTGTQWGGFIGRCESDTFNYCYATGSIEGGGGKDGGFFGGEAPNCTFTKCSATGDVDSKENAGGFGGDAISSLTEPVTFTDCYAWGDVSVTDDTVGGFLGVGTDNYITFTNCYSVGAPTGTTSGGFGGIIDDNSIVAACYWDTETSGQETTSNDIGDGHITTWMKTKTNYTDVGWDFDDIWYSAYTASTLVNVSGTVRLIPFEFSVSEAYVIELGHEYISFFRTTP